MKMVSTGSVMKMWGLIYSGVSKRLMNPAHWDRRCNSLCVWRYKLFTHTNPSGNAHLSHRSASYPQVSTLIEHCPGAVTLSVASLGRQSHPSVQFSTVPIPEWYCSDDSLDKEKLCEYRNSFAAFRCGEGGFLSHTDGCTLSRGKDEEGTRSRTWDWDSWL